MKKFSFNIIYKFTVVIAFIAMAVSTTSCSKDLAERIGKDVSNSIAKSADFDTAVRCIRTNCEWNDEGGYFEKQQGSVDDAISTLRRYTNNKMDVPGEWHFKNGNYIIIRKSSTPGDIFDIDIRTTEYDYNNNPCGKKDIKAHFVYDRIINN